MFQIAAKIDGAGVEMSNICCFDPTVVMARLRRHFPEVETNPEDFAWRAYDFFKEQGAGDGIEGAVRVAASDARRRGPIWTFSLPIKDRPPVRGRAERYDVSIWSDEPIPEPLRSRFISFLEELRFAPCVSIKSVRLLKGNKECPA